MTRYERRIYSLGVVIAAILIIEMVAVKAEECGKIDVYAAPAVQVDNFTAETAGEPEKGQIREDSAMPCDDPERFAQWYEEHRRDYEQETGEESRDDTMREDLETVAETEPGEAGTAMESPVPIYRINGEAIDEGLQIRLYHHLEAAGIAYWYEGALAQMYQESHCQQYAVNPHNGIDCGLYQYRSTFWTGPGDIFDVDAQFSRYAAEMAARFNAGLSTDEAISRHNTSDYVSAVNWEYVKQVRQWMPMMEVVR